MNDAAQEIAAATRRFLALFAANDVAGLAACYTEDAQMIPASMAPVRGRAAIASVFKFTAVRGHRLEFRSEELEVHDDTAVELGSYSRKQADGALVDQGRFFVVWKRGGGEWRIHRDMFSTSLPRTAARGASLPV